ncbi:MAG: PTS transporter subunit EIIC [Atopobiaceae bacterium]|jgi:glucose-like phosphotransferase system IIB component|nr:PTS transporter subunit EIIC [Atopobiaceae bacterium]
MATKEKYQELADNIVGLMGGESNISFFTHCITRLRFNVKDKGLVDVKGVEKLAGVVGTQWSGDQFQVIIGQAVGEAYDLIVSQAGIGNKENESDSANEPKKKFGIATLFDAITGCIVPLLPLLVGAGLVKVICILMRFSGLVSTQDPTYLVLSFVGDAGFYFLPIFVGWSAAKKFKTSIPIGMLLGAMLLAPSFVEAVKAGTPLSFLGLPIQMVSYSSQILPTIIAVYLLSFVERFVSKHTPDCLKFALTALIPLLVMVPVTLCAVGPIGLMLGNYLGDFMSFISSTFGFLAFGIFAALFPFLVMTGMHTTLVPILFNVIATTGYVVFPSVAFTVPNLCQGAAAAAVAVRTKNKELRHVAASTAITAVVAGVTEPAMYGVNLKYRKPMIGVCIGAFVGGCIGGLWGVKLYTLVGTSGLFAIAGYIGPELSNLIGAVVAIVVGSIVSFVSTLFLYKDDDSAVKDEIAAAESEVA